MESRKGGPQETSQAMKEKILNEISFFNKIAGSLYLNIEIIICLNREYNMLINNILDILYILAYHCKCVQVFFAFNFDHPSLELVKLRKNKSCEARKFYF